MNFLDRALRESGLLALGLLGTTEINTTNPQAGHWWRITPQEDTVFTTLTDLLADPRGDSPAGETYAKGIPIMGDFRVIELASGRVIADMYPVIP